MSKERLLIILMERTYKRALEVLADEEYWCDYEDDEHGNGEEAKVAFEEAIVRCVNSDDTDTDWDWLIEMTEV